MTELKVRGNQSARHVVMTAPTEVDLVNLADLSSRLAAACGSTDVITVDMTAPTFCHVAGIRALARPRDLAEASGGELRLAASSPAVQRILQLTGLDQDVPVYTDAQQSLRPPRRPEAV